LNPHNKKVVHPKNFPARSDKNFIMKNKEYESIHVFDVLLSSEK
jgi:hypothetical protein